MAVDWKKYWHKTPGIIRWDFTRKVFALLLTGIICLALREKHPNTEDSQTFKEIPVELPASVTLPNENGQTVLLRKDPKPVLVTIKLNGPRWLLQKYSSSDFSIQPPEIDSKKFTEGMPYKLHLTPDNVQKPFFLSAKVESVHPDNIEINFDVQKTKTVKIAPVFDSKKPLPEGYAIQKITLTPSEIRVTGPAAILENLETLQTRPIPLDGIVQSFDYNAAITVSAPGVKLSQDTVFAQINIERSVITQEFPLLPLRVLDDKIPNGYEFLSGDRVSVTLSGAKTALAKLKPEDVKPYIDISHLVPGIYNLPVNCWVTPPEFRIVKTEPTTIKVKISKK
ncbi:MAG TPA: hypothetical protein DDZ11_08620 [Lentisphaeria bacterium]|nr:hypothetical protein [Lentisphaeria bacterium]